MGQGGSVFLLFSLLALKLALLRDFWRLVFFEGETSWQVPICDRPIQIGHSNTKSSKICWGLQIYFQDQVVLWAGCCLSLCSVAGIGRFGVQDRSHKMVQGRAGFRRPVQGTVILRGSVIAQRRSLRLLIIVTCVLSDHESQLLPSSFSTFPAQLAFDPNPWASGFVCAWV